MKSIKASDTVLESPTSWGLFCTPTSNKDGIFLREKGKKGEFCATFSHDPLFRDYIDYI